MPYGIDAVRLRALKANFGSSKFTGAPAILYWALAYSATPASVVGTEPDSTGNYARVAMNNDDTEWTFGLVDVSNTDEVRYPSTTGLYSTDPNALNQWLLYDNSSSGNLIAFGELTTTILVTGSGDVPVIPPASVVITERV